MSEGRADAPVLLTVNDVAITAGPTFWGMLTALWGLMTWLAGRSRPQRSLPARLAVGLLSALAMISADVGHAVAHTVSAWLADAPMNEIRLSYGMPRTIYYDNDVAPRQHRTRALGGPIFSMLGLASVLALRRLTPRDSAGREVLGWAAVAHSFIGLGSLAPLPMVDGGSILKWTLVEQGKSEGEADVIVKEVDLALGLAASTVGAALTGRRRWLPGLGLAAAGLFAIAAGLGKVR